MGTGWIRRTTTRTTSTHHVNYLFPAFISCKSTVTLGRSVLDILQKGLWLLGIAFTPKKSPPALSTHHKKSPPATPHSSLGPEFSSGRLTNISSLRMGCPSASLPIGDRSPAPHILRCRQNVSQCSVPTNITLYPYSPMLWAMNVHRIIIKKLIFYITSINILVLFKNN